MRIKPHLERLAAKGTRNHESTLGLMCFLCFFVANVFVFIFGFCALLGALVFSDRLSLGEQLLTKRPEHLKQQIEFPQTLTARAHGAEKKLELNPSTTISNRQHAVAPLVFTTAARFNFRQNVRSVTGI